MKLSDRGYNRGGNRNYNQGGSNVLREYKCFPCNVSFTSTTPGPSCGRCGQRLKGRRVN